MARCPECDNHESESARWGGKEGQRCKDCHCIWSPETGEILLESARYWDDEHATESREDE